MVGEEIDIDLSDMDKSFVPEGEQEAVTILEDIRVNTDSQKIKLLVQPN